MKYCVTAMTFLALAQSIPAEAQSRRVGNVGGWEIAAHGNLQTRQFSHCSASVPYRSGIIMIFSVNRAFAWSMGFANERWTLRKGDQFEVAYAIDGGAQTRATALAVDSKVVEVPLPGSMELFAIFRRGKQLALFAHGGIYRFDLTNSSRALAAVLECARVEVAKSPEPVNPFQAPSSPGDQTAGAEASAVAANVLAASGIGGFRVLTPDEVPPELRSFDAVWTTQSGILGIVSVLLPGAFDNLDKVATAVIARDSNLCKGRFVSAKQDTPNATGIRVITGCDASQNPTQGSYTVVARPKGGFYVFAVFGRAQERESAKEIDGRVSEAALRFAAKGPAF